MSDSNNEAAANHAPSGGSAAATAASVGGSPPSLHRFAFPTPIVFGAGARKEVTGHLRAAGYERPLLVTDRGLAALPVFEAFLRNLSGVTHAVFCGIWGNPVRSQAMQGAEAFREHRADSIIGIGGGAAIDVAKAIALMAEHPGDVLEYAWDFPNVRAITRA